VGAFAFGRSRGVCEGVLAAAGIPATFIAPAAWKRAIGIKPGREGAKDAARAEATRRRARQCGPDNVAFLHFVVRTDKFASSAQRVRAAIVLLEVGEFLAPETKAAGLFREAEEVDGADEREAS
jgi:hypothetical protein